MKNRVEYKENLQEEVKIENTTNDTETKEETTEK